MLGSPTSSWRQNILTMDVEGEPSIMGLVVVRDALVWFVAYLLLRPDRPIAKPVEATSAR